MNFVKGLENFKCTQLSVFKKKLKTYKEERRISRLALFSFDDYSFSTVSTKHADTLTEFLLESVSNAPLTNIKKNDLDYVEILKKVRKILSDYTKNYMKKGRISSILLFVSFP